MTLDQTARAYMSSIHRLRSLTGRELDRAQMNEPPQTEQIDAAFAEMQDYRRRYVEALTVRVRV